MKKKFLKGEISTIITLGTLIVVGISSLASTVFLKKTQTIKTKAAGCSQVSSVSYSGNVAPGQTFTCLASTNGASPYTMACGISKNGGWPYGMRSGSCSGTRCTFSVKMDDQVEAGAVYDLVAFDFRTECGPDKGNKTPLNVSGTQPQPTQANCDEGCCGMPDGFIYQRAIKESCDSNYKGGRYVIIDGVCQGGKRTEKPGCATCRTCQAGAPDIAPVPGADLAVNECNSSCEQKEGGNPTPNPNSSTPTQTITSNPNPRVSQTKTPISTIPNPTGITQESREGQPCKIGVRDGKTHYYCDGNLVCSTQFPHEIGICVFPTPTKILASTPDTTPATTSTPDKKSTEDPTPTPAGTCTNYGVYPHEGGLTCPHEYPEECDVLVSLTAQKYKGTRYVRRDCGQNSDSCRFSCKKIEDLRNDKYSGDCSRENTCLVPELSTIPVRVKITVKNQAKKWIDMVAIADKNDNVLARQKFGCFLSTSVIIDIDIGCTRINYTTSVMELTIRIPRYYPPHYIFPIQISIDHAEQQYGGSTSKVSFDRNIQTLNIQSPIELEIDLQQVKKDEK